MQLIVTGIIKFENVRAILTLTIRAVHNAQALIIETLWVQNIKRIIEKITWDLYFLFLHFDENLDYFDREIYLSKL